MYVYFLISQWKWIKEQNDRLNLFLIISQFTLQHIQSFHGFQCSDFGEKGVIEMKWGKNKKYDNGIRKNNRITFHSLSGAMTPFQMTILVTSIFELSHNDF